MLCADKTTVCKSDGGGVVVFTNEIFLNLTVGAQWSLSGCGPLKDITNVKL